MSATPRHPRPRFVSQRTGLLLALMVAGCGEPSAEWTSERVETPTEFAPGVISTASREYGIAITPDGREAYFTRRGRRGPPEILVSRFVEGSWTEPENTSFAGDRDEAPFLVGDGSRMLFASSRPTGNGWDRSENIWVVERDAEGWSEPSPLGGAVNQPREEIGDYTLGTESGPVLLADGTLMYWARSDPDWGSDLFVADPDGRGGFESPRPLRINSYGDESSPAMSPDGRHLIFQGYRDAEAVGDQDLYVSVRTPSGWSDPEALPEPINSARNDGYPSFSSDGRFFFFASDRNARAGYYDIFYLSVDALSLP